MHAQPAEAAEQIRKQVSGRQLKQANEAETNHANLHSLANDQPRRQGWHLFQQLLSNHF